VLGVTSALVTVNEGSTATNAGTFSDADGNSTVTLTASVGVISQNNATGKWSWAFLPADGPDQSQTVTITANDGVNVTTRTFQLTVNNVAPAVQTSGTAVASATLVHRYDLNGTLADPLGGPTLAAHGGTLSSSRYTFGANQGLQLDGGLVNTANYSIELVMEVDAVTPFWKKIVDFANLTSDSGLYVSGNTLTLYPGATGSGTITANTDFHVVLTRNAATGETRTYLNGILQRVYTGSVSGGAVSAMNRLIFFEDDNVTGRGEAQGGSVDYIRVYDGPLSAADVTTLNQVRGNGQPTVSVDEGQQATLSGTFHDPGSDAVTVTASVGTVSQAAGTPGAWTWTYLAPDGPVQNQVVTVTATDSDGAATSTTLLLNIANVAPSVDADQATVTVDEGQTAMNTGVFSDPGLDTVTLMASVGAVVDEGGGVWSWSFVTTDGPDESQTVTITATDSDGAVASTTFALVVNNVAPVIDNFDSNVAAGDTVSPGTLLTIDGTFSDAGTADTHHAMIDWGDGTQAALGEGDVDQAADTFGAGHVFTVAGIYTVTVTLYDDDGGADVRTLTVLVSGMAVHDGVLYVIGTNEADRVLVHQQGNGRIKVHADFLPDGKWLTVGRAGVSQMVVVLGDGNDHLTVAGNIALPAIVHGGAGNDHLRGGRGPSVLLGDEGNDFIQGGPGYAMLIGGAGQDRLVAGGRDDVLIGGSTAQDGDWSALEAALDAWTSADSWANRAALVESLLAVVDDHDVDHLTCRPHRDLVFAGVGDFGPRDHGHGHPPASADKSSKRVPAGK
jgi:hypothetical protein